MRIIGSLHYMASRIGNRDNMASGIGSRNRVKSDLGLSITLYNMLNSMVLSNVLRSKSSIGDSSVVAGVVVAGDAVGYGSSNIG